MGREKEVGCPYLEFHLDLQVSPIDGEQCTVETRGAQLPGAVGHVPVAVSQEDQWGEGGEGAFVCRGGEEYCTSSAHPLTPHSHTLSMV